MISDTINRTDKTDEVISDTIGKSESCNDNEDANIFNANKIKINY